MVKVGVIMGTWETLPDAKFCESCLRGYTPLGQKYTKNLQHRVKNTAAGLKQFNACT